MTQAGGPDGCRALILRIAVTMSDGSEHVLDTSRPEEWSVSAGPVSWDHFFRKGSSSICVSFPATSPTVTCCADGETYNGHVDIATPPAAGQPAREMAPPASSPPGMEVTTPTGEPVALGPLAHVVGPPLRIVQEYPAVSVTKVRANDVASTGWVFDFAQNFAGMSRLSLPAGHGIPPGTELRIEQAEIVAGPFVDTGGMCELCPTCGPCALRLGGEAGLTGNSNCAAANAAEGAVGDTYCSTTVHAGAKPLRHEPCFPHQTLKGLAGHETPDRYIVRRPGRVLVLMYERGCGLANPVALRSG